MPGWGKYAQSSSLAVCVNPGSAFNCYWAMLFRKGCRMTLQNLSAEPLHLYYQINYTLADVPEDAGYFHAQFRRVNPLPLLGDFPGTAPGRPVPIAGPLRNVPLAHPRSYPLPA
jgi:hypothetical protein